MECLMGHQMIEKVTKWHVDEDVTGGVEGGVPEDEEEHEEGDAKHWSRMRNLTRNQMRSLVFFFYLDMLRCRDVACIGRAMKIRIIFLFQNLEYMKLLGK
ncbi:hypothetical protein O0L34_g3660 [Tuta absoluta]|nr:hypothetical protein O0L34_g3660 [Tuta absoluta]